MLQGLRFNLWSDGEGWWKVVFGEDIFRCGSLPLKIRSYKVGWTDEYDIEHDREIQLVESNFPVFVETCQCGW